MIRHVSGMLFCSIAALLPLCATADEWVDANGNTWSYTAGASAITISGCSFATNVVTIPDEISGKPVRTISQNAFKGNKTIRELTIPDSITTLGQGAFSGCTALETITLGDGITALPAVYYEGQNLMGSGFKGYVDWKNDTGISELFDKAIFYNCTSLKTVNFGRNLQTIGNLSFLDCKSLKEVTLPESVSTIGKHAFYRCSSLLKVTVKGNVSLIGKRAFGACPTLLYVDFQGQSMTTTPESGVFDFDRERLIVYAAEGSTGWTGSVGATGLPDGGTWCGKTIAYGPPAEVKTYTATFDPHGGILSETSRTAYHDAPVGSLPVPVAPEGGWSFSGWYSSEFDGTKITASYVVTNDVTFYAHWTGNGTYDDGNGTSFGYRLDGNKIYVVNATGFSGDIVLPARIHGVAVHGVAAWAFEACKQLTGVTIPDTMTKIGDGAFAGCTALEYVNFGTNICEIGGMAFYSCRALKMAVLPDSVTNLSAYRSFGDCRALRRVRLGAGLVSLKNWSASSYASGVYIGGRLYNSVSHSPFWNCTALETVELGERALTLGTEAFFNSVNLKHLVCRGPLPGIDGNLDFSGQFKERFCYVLRGIYPDGLPQEKWAGLTVRYLDDYAVPEVSEHATAEEVNAALEGIEFADAEGIKEAIGGDAAKYAEFRRWARGLSAGEVAVVVSTNAAVSYLLGAERLFENVPNVEFGGVEAGADDGQITVSVIVKDVEEPVQCAAEKVKDMFEAVSDLKAWAEGLSVGADSLYHLPVVVTVVGGSDAQGAAMCFRVSPGDSSAGKAFLRIKVK